MIRIIDSFTLAYTKLRVHRIRTGIIIGVSGILFGLILAIIFVMQGAFDSFARFSTEGLGERSIVMVSKFNSSQFIAYDHQTDEAFVTEVEQLYNQTVAKKTAAAKKYSISYDKTTDPSPIEKDPITKQKRISDTGMQSSYVSQIVLQHVQKDAKPLDINEFIARYHYKTATVLPDNQMIQPPDGNLSYMKNNIDPAFLSESERQSSQYSSNNTPPNLVLTNQSITRPFVPSHSFDPAKGEIPVVIPYSEAEKLLGYTSFDKHATLQDKLNRLEQVRQRVGEISASYCYRNPASTQLVALAQAQQKEITDNKANQDYQMPALLYELPTSSSCGPVTVKKDTRTATEKKEAANLIAYQKEIGEYLGEPVQHRVAVRGVGISGDMPEGTSLGSSVSQTITSLMGSWLGYNQWSIPADLFYELPEQYRPSYVFSSKTTSGGQAFSDRASLDTYLVEFGDKNEARDALVQGSFFSGSGLDQNQISVSPYGNASLMIDEFKRWFQSMLLWALLVVGGIALVILASLIGRAVSDGRRESAIFRAIGARRGDIGRIYGSYALLLGLRVVVFSLVLGLIIAGVIEILFWQDATLGARYAYAASDASLQFHLCSIMSWYVPGILGVIIIVALVASIIPILLGARRNPINDMRSE